MKRPGGKATTVIGLLGVMGVMVVLVVNAVPLYRLFCQVTGYGGTTQTASAPPPGTAERTVTVRFNADTDPDLPWSFQPVQREMTVRLGETALAYYKARSRASRPVTGRATYNVTPAKAGIYFSKIDCFCFTEQTLPPGEAVDMPVQFFVDPEMAQDRGLDDVTTITLSYTFFRAPDPEKPPDASGRTASAPPARNGRIALN